MCPSPSHSPVVRFTFVEKGTRALEHVRAVEDSFRGVDLRRDALVDIEPDRQVDEPLDLANGERPTSGNVFGDRVSSGSCLTCGYDPTDEADALRFLRID